MPPRSKTGKRRAGASQGASPPRAPSQGGRRARDAGAGAGSEDDDEPGSRGLEFEDPFPDDVDVEGDPAAAAVLRGEEPMESEGEGDSDLEDAVVVDSTAVIEQGLEALGIDVPELEDPDSDSEAPPQVAYHPGVATEQPVAELEMSQSAYTMYHSVGWEWPCLSFDVVRDNLGESRSRFPLTAFAVSGSQAPPGQNRLTLLKMSDMHRTQGSGDSDDEAEEADELEAARAHVDGDLEVDPLLDFRTVPHDGVVNRVRCMRQHPNIVASWSDTATVHVWNLAAPLLSFDAPQPGATNVQPCYSFGAHPVEGFAMDWSPTTPGRLLTGDCERFIYLWEPDTGAGVPAWGVDLRPYGGHTASVEDLQWSPVQADVFASCSVDRSIRIWDVRQRAAAQLSVEGAHEADVNVISWNSNTTHLLVSGSDDGSFKVWDLRRFAAGSPPIGHFQWHQGPVTSVEWHPTDDSVLAVAGEDNQLTVWDLSLEPDEEARIAHKGAQPPQDVPPQLLFVHQGQTDIKELHFHPQLPGVVMSTALDGFNVFKPSNL